MNKVHNHSGLEKKLGLDKDHVIIDKELFNEIWTKEQKQEGIATCDLVEQLKKREGVEEINMLPHQPYRIQAVQPNGKDDEDRCKDKSGPARILIIID